MEVVSQVMNVTLSKDRSKRSKTEYKGKKEEKKSLKGCTAK